jgi:transcriptional regulator with XRE-family HTH domain
MASTNRLGEFLTARRARVSPEEAGVVSVGLRRVPGLRREEVAALAGLSIDYYTRLEQGRERHPSPGVLHALARALHLEPDAQRYLFSAVAPVGTAPAIFLKRRVGANLLAMVQEWSTHPAVLLDPCFNIIAANQLGRALYDGHEHSDNLFRLVFLDSDAPVFLREWHRVADVAAAGLRAALSHDPDNPELRHIIRELRTRSPEFSRRWADAEVREKTSDVLRVLHPLVGELDLTFETLRPNGDTCLLLVYRAEPGSRSAEALSLLGSLTAEQGQPAPGWV